MKIQRLLVANRGEIAIRVMRAAAELGVPTVAVYAADDEASLHVRMAGDASALRGEGAAAYLDAEQIVEVARETGCDAIHPGYGFLSENAAFARLCLQAGITFVGPRPEILELFGDKVRARRVAGSAGVPVLRASHGDGSIEELRSFFRSLGGQAMIIKAVAGGGGRGVRIVEREEDLESAYARCSSEAKAAFGDAAVYGEELLGRARHIEVQVLGDGEGNISHLWERECSLQRRHQKILEVAPSAGLGPELRQRIIDAALALARAVRYDNIGTFEFLVDAAAGGPGGRFAFIEANPRLQVEHTVTEEVTGVDIVQAQLELSAGATLDELGLAGPAPAPRGFAIQARVNMETMRPDGTTAPSGGTLTAFQPPSGPGIRTDTFGYAGYVTSPRYDSLLAKVIAHSPGPRFEDAVQRAYRALVEFRVEGVATNIAFLQGLLQHPDFRAGKVYTRFIDDHLAALLGEDSGGHLRLFPETGAPPATGKRLAGVKVDTSDPLAVLAHGKQGTPAPRAIAAAKQAVEIAGPAGTVPVVAPLQGTIVSIDFAAGDTVREGQELFVMEAMKMEHVVTAPVSGVAAAIGVERGDAVYEGHALAFIEEAAVEGGGAATTEEVAPDFIRPDLAEVLARDAAALDEARPEAVERRRKTGQRTARENIGDLCDPGTFVEHGRLVLTPGTGLPIEEVIRRFPADGMVTGVGSVNAGLFGPDRSRCVVLSYDYTVLAGTQGPVNHPKTDRMFQLAEKWMLPVVFFTEGGGGRAGTGGRREGGRPVDGGADAFGGRALDTPTFASMGRLSGLVPLVGINSGRCFAGNAALLGCCDVIIATANSNIGMGGPAMIEGGGLGVFRPEEVGPMDVQVPNGVVDIAVADEAEAVQAARKYLSYFQGPTREWEADDQRKLRHVIPENRLRMYDVRRVIEALCDTGSVLELRRDFGLGMVTVFGRIEGRPIGILANNPAHLAGAIDSDGSDKAARFMQLCDAFDIPLVVLCDTPGIMVGPEVERTALVRHCSRLFVTGANLSIPHFTVVLRKAYGLGAQAMAGGSFKEPFFAVAWPTAEFGGMGLEGQVKLGFRNELAAIEDPHERLERYNHLVARAYERGKALSYGVSFGVDDVIDPMETRSWIANGLRSVPAPLPRREKKRNNLDTW